MKKKWLFSLIFSQIFISLLGGASGYSQNQVDTTGYKFLQEGIRLNNNGFPDQALEKLNLAIEQRTKKIGKEDYVFANIYNSIGVAYKNLWQFDRAIYYYKKSEELFVKFYGYDFPLIGDVLQNMANILRKQGNYFDAINYQRKSIDFLYKDMGRYRSNWHYAKFNLATLLNDSKKNEEALKIINENLNTCPDDLKSDYYYTLAKINIDNGDNLSAYNNFLVSINVLKTKFPNRIKDLATSYYFLSRLLITEERFNEALAYIKEIESIINNKLQKNILIKTQFYELSGDFYINNKFNKSEKPYNEWRRSQIIEGIRFYLKIFDFSGQNLFTDKLNISINGNLRNIDTDLRILSNLGDAYLEMAGLYDEKEKSTITETLQQSLTCYQKASELLQFARSGFISEESKSLISQLQQPIFHSLNKVAYELYATTGDITYFDLALQNTERNKAAGLTDILADRLARKGGLIPDSLNDKENEINARLAYYNEKLFNERNAEHHNDSLISSTEKLVFDLERTREEFVKNLEKQYPEYFNIKYSRASTTVESVMRKLRKDEALLEYSLEKPADPGKKPSLSIFCISPAGHYFNRIEIDSTFFRNLDEVARFVTNPEFMFTEKRDILRFGEASFGLYDKLIRPVEPFIGGRRLTIIPDRELNYLPFDALLTSWEGNPSADLRTLPYLIRSHAINYSYSAEWQYGKAQAPRAKERLIAFAPDYTNLPSGNSEWSGFAPIPGIREEVGYISRKIRSAAFEDNAATELNFRQKAGDFDIIHLAMHTLLNDTLPMFSKLAFTAQPGGPVENDGWLNTSDIYNLKLRARMVVLSACNTGTGKLRDGEGIISLARGFSYAGCPSVVMTLWEVRDRSGAAIMKDFYRNIKAGKQKDDALRLAKLDFLKDADQLMAHPHFWLGYVAIGNPEPLFRDIGFYLFIILMPVLVILVAGQVYRYKKARRKPGLTE